MAEPEEQPWWQRLQWQQQNGESTPDPYASSGPLEDAPLADGGPVSGSGNRPADIRQPLFLRPVPTTDIGHPLADRIGGSPETGDWVATETRSRIVHFTPMLANLLAVALRDGSKPVLISDELSTLTQPFSRIWQQAGGCWVIRQSTGGLRNGFTGRRLSRIEDAWMLPPPSSLDDFAINFLRPTRIDGVQLTTIVGLRQPPRESTLLGAATERLGLQVLGTQPTAWAAHEPAGSPWNREELTAAIRERMPAETAVIAAGENLSATISGQRTEHGVEEVDHVTVHLGRPDDRQLAGYQSAAADVLRWLAGSAMPLVGLQLMRPGRADLTVPPTLLPTPVPLTLLIGAPAVRSFGLDVKEMQERYGAEPVGRPRIPALLFELGTPDPDNWRRLDDILAGLDPAALAAALGRGAGRLTEVRDQAARADRPLEDPDA